MKIQYNRLLSMKLQCGKPLSNQMLMSAENKAGHFDTLQKIRSFNLQFPLTEWATGLLVKGILAAMH